VTRSRREALWGLVASRSAGQLRRVSVADVCAVAVSCAQVTGAWVTAASGLAPDFVMCVTDPVSEQLAELQLTLGEGPGQDVQASAAPVLAGDLSEEPAGRRWPAFTPGAAQLGAAAVFAFPLTIGAIQAGTMGLYRISAGPLSRAQFGDCLLLADTATVLLLDGAAFDGAAYDGAAYDGDGDGSEGLDGQAPDLALHRSEVDQATGMLTLQLGVPAVEAFARLRAYAYAQDRRLADVAADIVARRLRLSPEPGRAPDATA
jgi:ANTAR domain